MNRHIAAIALATLLALPAGGTAQTNDVRIRVNGRAQVQFNTTSVGEAEAGDPDSEIAGSTFETRRVRLAADLTIRDWITGRVEADFAGGAARLTDGWLNLGFTDAAQLRIGQFKKPFSLIELTSSTQILPIERGVRIRNLTDALLEGAQGDAARLPATFGEEVIVGEEYEMLAALGYLGREIGAMLHGGSDRFTYGVGVFNGSGAGLRDDNDDKSFAGRATFQPAANRPFVLGAGFSRRETRAAGDDLSGTVLGLDAEWGEFRRPGLHVQLDGVLGDNLLPDRDLRGAQGVVAWFAPLAGARAEGVEPLLRASYGDPRTDVDGDEGWLVTPGINLYFFGRNRLMFNWDVYLPSAEWQETQHALRAQAQLHF